MPFIIYPPPIELPPAEECDATDDDSRSSSWQPKIKTKGERKKG